MKITLSPTGIFHAVTQPTGRVLCRIWQGVSDSGAPIIAHIPLISLHNSATPAEQEAFERALCEVKAERELVSFDMRMVI